MNKNGTARSRYRLLVFVAIVTRTKRCLICLVTVTRVLVQRSGYEVCLESKKAVDVYK